jgi:cobalt-zinc-cadmium efflux system protein
MNHRHDHDHSHSLERTSELAGVSDWRLMIAVVLNQILTVAEFLAGVISGSVALVSDAVHNFNDANALLIAYIARRISRKSSNQQYTFGYRRAEMIGAMINLTLLGGIGVYLVYEAVWRFFDPQPILGWLMAGASIIALIIDVATAWLLWSMSHGSLNVRAAFIHNLVDALGSLAVLVGALAIIYLDWTWVDPTLTLLIAGYILYQVYQMLPKAARVLMEGAPENLDFDALVRKLELIDGVESIHHLHIWELDANHNALEAHVVVSHADLMDIESMKMKIKHMLADEFNVHHSTLEFEIRGTETDCCDESSIISQH